MAIGIHAVEAENIVSARRWFSGTNGSSFDFRELCVFPTDGFACLRWTRGFIASELSAICEGVHRRLCTLRMQELPDCGEHRGCVAGFAVERQSLGFSGCEMVRIGVFKKKNLYRLVDAVLSCDI